ncbi:gamma-glutamylcyclotransferase [Bacillus songklensis]|uniref:Gamma-glutamylcyclotransferase n=1 Tax=Bacillus songklensis TaxID=1069116 RepID=A0ABV8B0M8_9BACI
MTVVFVYGTLRQGEENHFLLKDAACLARQARTKGRLYDTKLGYPAVEAGDDGWVYGELYEVTGEQFSKLDELEGYEEGYYDRIVQTVYTDRGEMEAWVYIAGDNKELLKELIPNGDWCVHRLYDNCKDVYYFAYGSCMDMERFELAGVASHFQQMVGLAKLPDHKVRFTHLLHDGSRADIVEEDGVVEGKLYRLPLEAIEYLYKREGVGSGHYRPAVVSVEHNGRLVDRVLTFIVVNKGEEAAPPDHYATEILRGGANVLSDDYLDELKKHITSLPGACRTS